MNTPPATFRSPTRFGEFGGCFAPETLMAPLLELESIWLDSREDAGFRAKLERLLSEYAGRPTPLTHAERSSARLDRHSARHRRRTGSRICFGNRGQ